MRTAEDKTPTTAARQTIPFFNKNMGQHFFGPGAESNTFFQNPSSPVIQPKLSIGQPNDKYEKEADAVAQKVVSSSAPAIQTKCEECEKEESLQKQSVPEEEGLQMQPMEEEEEMLQAQPMEEEEELQMKPSLQLKGDAHAGRTTASPSIQSKISSSKGRGRSLDSNSRSFMESRMQMDFSSVNVHTDNEAIQMNRELGARAFTVGSDIYFNKGEYRPETSEGKKLLAHELTHTLQQKKGILKKKGNNEHINIDNNHSQSITLSNNTISHNSECQTAIDSVIPFDILFFENNVSALNAMQIRQIDNLVKNINISGNVSAIRLDGYASPPGLTDYNINLSCDRAINVGNELVRPSDGSLGIPRSLISIYKHGETSEYGQDQQSRRVNITLEENVQPDSPQPTLPPAILETALRECQTQCVKRLGGCPETRPAGIPTAEEIAQYNESCRSETGYSGPDIHPSSDSCSAWLNVEVIPEIMDSNGWVNGGTVLREWFNNPSSGGVPNTSTVTMDWILSFSKAKEVYDKIFAEHIYVNEAAQREINTLVTRLGVRSGGGFNFQLPVTQLDPPSQGSQNYSINFRAINAVSLFSELNDLSATLGNFAFKVLVAGNVDLSGLVTITDVGVYVKDSFDFKGDQSLGCWNPCTNEVGKISCGGGVNVGNAEFRQWRQRNSRGGDFKIYSDIKSKQLDHAESFNLPNP